MAAPIEFNKDKFKMNKMNFSNDDLNPTYFRDDDDVSRF